MDGMAWVPGATFLMGSDQHYPEEAPAHRVTVAGFWIDAGPVTNQEFGRFVRKTGYVTVAERAPDPADYPGARRELLVPFSTVFVAPQRPVSLTDPYSWWKPVRGADWRHPMGPGSSIRHYCRRYRPAARMAQSIDTSTCHLGFRCVVRDTASSSGSC